MGSDTQTGRDEDRSWRLSPTHVVAAAASLTLLARALRGPLDDPDTWWHLVQGSWMLERHSILRMDYFSVTELGQPLIAHAWLSEVLLALTQRLGGFVGLVTLRALALLSTYAVLAVLLRRLRGDDLVRWALVIAAAVAGAGTWAVRPTMFGLLLFAVTLLLLRTGSSPNRWLLVPVFALWTNLHGSWVLGLGTVGLWWLARILRPEEDQHRLVAAALPVGCALATLLNPYGWRLHTHALELIVEIRSIGIDEWAPQRLEEPDDFVLLALGVVAAVSLVRSRPRRDPFDILAGMAFLVLAVTAVRNGVFAAMVFAVIAAAYVPSPLPAKTDSSSRRAMEVVLPAASLLAVIVVVALVVVRDLPRSTDPVVVAGPNVPGVLLEGVTGTAEQPARLLTLDLWAGLALYQHWPGVLVLNDTRVDLYGPEGVELHRRLLAGDDPALLDDLCITDVVVPATTPVVETLGGAWTRIASQRLATGTEAVHFKRPRPGCGGSVSQDLGDVDLVEHVALVRRDIGALAQRPEVC